MIDQAKKFKLINDIKRRQDAGAKEILLQPTLYFDGYDDDLCVVCANNSTAVSTARFAELLERVQSQPEVLSVFVRFYDYDDAIKDEGCWIGSDSVYIVTKASVDEVREWFEVLEPTSVQVANPIAFSELAPIPPNFNLVEVWWD